MKTVILSTATRGHRPAKAAAALGLFLALAAAPARASFDDVPLSPRNASLADSNGADVTDASGFLLNPAAAAGIRRWELYANDQILLTGLSDGSSISRQVVTFGAPFKWGTVVAGVNNFTGGTLYSETDDYLGFGKAAFGNKFWFGGTLHSMGVKYASDQYTALNPQFGSGAKSAMGIDVGMIYFGKNYNLGLAILDANQPDVGIAFPDPVDRKIRISASFHPLSALSLDTALSEIGTETKLAFGGEFHQPRSNFFFRAGADLGAQDYRTLAFGLAYRTKNYQFDYAMSLPLSGVQTTLGNQQFSFTARWGRVKRKLPERYADDEPDLDENGQEKPLQKVIAKSAATTAEEQEKAREALDQARKDLLAGRFREGLDKLKESNAAQISPADVEELKAIGEKAEAVASIYATVNVTNNRTRLVHDAITAYMQGDGKRAVNTVTYAWQLNPEDQNLVKLRALITRAFPLDAFELKLLPGVKLTDQKLQEALESIYDGKYITAVSTCKEILDLEPDNILAMIRMGSAYWAMGMEDQARVIWTKAQTKDPGNEILRKFLSRQSGQSAGAARSASPETQEEFKSKVAYYERLQRSGADAQTLAGILKKIIDQFEGTGVDLTQVYKDYEAVKAQ